MASKTQTVNTELKSKNQTQNMDIINETYVDGVATISIRQNVAKLDFYQASLVMNEENTGAEGQQQEFRKISHRLVLPVSGLVELHEILDKMRQDRDKN